MASKAKLIGTELGIHLTRAPFKRSTFGSGFRRNAQLLRSYTERRHVLNEEPPFFSLLLSSLELSDTKVYEP